MMVSVLASSAWDNFTTGFGVAAAILAVGGVVFLRFQRSRHEFALMRAALEKGISDYPGGLPAWVVSAREGLMMLTLGVALSGLGVAAWLMADKELRLAPVAASQAAATMPAQMLAGPKPRDDRGRLLPEGRLYSEVRNRWERSRYLEMAGQIMTGSGIILIALGIVRLVFARVERKYSAEP